MNLKNILFTNKKTNLIIKIGMGVLLILIICLFIFRACSTDTDKTVNDNPYV